MPRKKREISSKRLKKLKTSSKKTLQNERDFLLLPDFITSLRDFDQNIKKSFKKFKKIKLRLTAKKLIKKLAKELTLVTSETNKKTRSRKRNSKHREVVIFQSKARQVEELKDKAINFAGFFAAGINTNLKKLKKTIGGKSKTLSAGFSSRIDNFVKLINLIKQQKFGRGGNNKKNRSTKNKKIHKIAQKKIKKSKKKSLNFNGRFIFAWFVAAKNSFKKSRIVLANSFLSYKLIIKKNLIFLLSRVTAKKTTTKKTKTKAKIKTKKGAQKLNKKSRSQFGQRLRKRIETIAQNLAAYFSQYPSELKNHLFTFKNNLAYQLQQLQKILLQFKKKTLELILFLPQKFLALRAAKNKKTSLKIPLTKEQRKKKERRQILLSVFFTVFIILSTWVVYDSIFADLPSAQDLKSKEQVVTTKIYDRHGKLLYRIYKDENRTIVTLKDISPNMVNATISIEDKSFYRHGGFDLKGIIRAFVANFQGDKIEQGGSTITQQLVKNRLLTTEKTVRRKLREVVLSMIVESVYSKDEILEMYFNQVPYGGSTYGVEEAAWRYFNKPAKDLSLAESSLLAGLPAAPSVFSPFGPNPELAYQRQHEVLRRMVEDGYITQEQADAAKQEKLVFRNDATDIKAPHFVMYVKKLLAEQFGEETLTQGGLEVYTTLDLDLQEKAQQVVSDEISSLNRLKISNGAALVTNPRTGEILSMVGSANYFDFAHDGQVNVVLRERQPGSSIKPLTYAVAMEKGQNPASIIDDSPITYKLQGSPPYSPKNYDGKYHGKVTLRESLASSYNIPAVKTLASVTVNAVIDKGEMLGIKTWQDRKRFGLSLTLGGGEVTMLDMSQLYSSFANMGYPVEPNPFLEIRNYKGEVFYRNDCALDRGECFTEQKLDPRVAYLISDILSDDNARAPAFGLRSFLHIPGQQVAVKTGTTNSLRDNWTIGYTTDRLVAVWVGNNDNTPMSYVASGVTGASPIWNEVMQSLLDNENPHLFATPSGIVKVKVCAKTGTLPCTGCPVVKEEAFIQGMEPTKACSPSYFRQKTEEEKQRERDRLLDL